MKEAIIPSEIETVSQNSDESLFEKAILLMDGKILKICSPQDIPSDFNIKRYQGVLTPGIIEPHCHLGVHETGLSSPNDTNEMVEPVTPHIRAEDGVNPLDPSFKTALESGITSLCILPGSANIFGGSGVIVKPVGNTLEQMVIKRHTALKAAFGENPKRVYAGKPGGPGTRMGIAGIFRTWMIKAQEYQEKLDNFNLEKSSKTLKKIPRDLKLEILTQVLRNERQLRVHVHRADDIMTCLRLCDEFGIKPCFEHATQADLVADELVKRNIMIAYGPVLSPPKKRENAFRHIKVAAELLKKGACLSLTTDHPVTSVDTLQICAAMLMRYGVTRKTALSSITLNAAKLCGIDDVTGSLESGKNGDMVLWSGDPLDARNIPLQVYISGERVL